MSPVILELHAGVAQSSVMYSYHRQLPRLPSTQFSKQSYSSSLLLPLKQNKATTAQYKHAFHLTSFLCNT